MIKRTLFPALAGSILWLSVSAAPPTAAGDGTLTVPQKALPVYYGTWRPSNTATITAVDLPISESVSCIDLYKG